MKITTLLFLFGLAVTLSLAQGADEYEDYVDEEPAPAPPPPPKPALRGLAAVRQARGPIIGRPSSKTQQVTKTTTTTTTTEAPLEYDDEEFLEEEQAEDPTTTTEAPKKGGITLRVRPFRSQESLIEALKRRRQQQSSGGSNPAPSTSAPLPPPEKSSKNGRKSSSSNKVFSDQTGSDSQTKNTVNGRRFNPRGKSSARTEAPQEEPVEEEVQPTRSRSFGGRGRRF